MVGPWKKSGEWAAALKLAKELSAKGSRLQAYEVSRTELRRGGTSDLSGLSAEDRKWAEEVVVPLAFDTAAWQLVSEAVSGATEAPRTPKAGPVSRLHWAAILLGLLAVVLIVRFGGKTLYVWTNGAVLVLAGAAGWKHAMHRGRGVVGMAGTALGFMVLYMFALMGAVFGLHAVGFIPVLPSG